MKIKFISIFLLCLTFSMAQAQVDRSKMPKPGPAPEISLGAPASFELDNGLKIMVVENHKIPKVSARLVLDNKPYAEGKKVGVKSLYSSMMGTGTENIDKESFNERVDFMGANISYGPESARASSLTRFFPEIFGLMADGLLNPFFTQKEFKTQKERLLEGIRSQEKSAQAVASDVRGALTYGKQHPYGEFATKESVEGLELSDVENYYNNFISPHNAYLVVVGDIKAKEVKDLAEKHLSSWREATPPTAEVPAAPKVQYTHVDFVDMPNAVQSEVSVVNTVELKKADSDYFAALMANQILGGGGEGRLFNNLREDKAYTYGAYSRLGNDKYVASFVASASVRNAVTDSAVVAFLNEIYKIRDEKVLEQELGLAKAKYTGNFVRALERPGTIANYALDIELEDLPKDFYQTYLQKISEVTVDDVQRVARKYFKPEHARIVIVGRGKDVAESLENLEYDGKPIPVKYYNKKAKPVEKPVFHKEVDDNVTVETVYDDYIKAIGGEAAINAVDAQYAKFSGSMGPQTLTLVTKRTKDGKQLTEVSMGGMVVQKVVFDGEKGYQVTQGQKQDIPEEQLETYKETSLFAELEVPEDAEVTGIEAVDGEDAYVVKLSDQQSEYYGVESGLKLQTVEVAPTGQEAVTGYGDYKAVQGVKFPHVMSLPLGPQSLEMKAEEIKVNENVSDADFE